ncbi:DUF4260 family protein [Demequina litorisediminis]|uniref:DUF4260 family protein n=1 Tax=Demequina litorisediminis TaxID=1849022 RepID=UPI003D671885
MSPVLWQRVESVAIAFTAVAVTVVGFGYQWWWLLALFLAFDLSAVGYVAGPRVGAALYNVGHSLRRSRAVRRRLRPHRRRLADGCGAGVGVPHCRRSCSRLRAQGDRRLSAHSPGLDRTETRLRTAIG